MQKGEIVLSDPIQQEWISYAEAERYSGLSHTTLWRYVSSGELQAARVGRSVRIHLPSLKRFMERKAAVPQLNNIAESSGGEEYARKEPHDSYN